MNKVKINDNNIQLFGGGSRGRINSINKHTSNSQKPYQTKIKLNSEVAEK